ncbi:unnamed protein product [Staurois parvus]|uniref:Uncharacterized protein n=1 Tax=Staurois parvus TaxID=386267 RepID=A0ABN9F8V9_9NEOB|nr:unnamed protein product [Staurois parvus]
MVGSSCLESWEYRGRGHLSGGFLVLGGSIISLCSSEKLLHHSILLILLFILFFNNIIIYEVSTLNQ